MESVAEFKQALAVELTEVEAALNQAQGADAVIEAWNGKRKMVDHWVACIGEELLEALEVEECGRWHEAIDEPSKAIDGLVNKIGHAKNLNENYDQHTDALKGGLRLVIANLRNCLDSAVN